MGEVYMDTKKIELNSILKLRSDLERCNEVITDIPDNDRTPSWDGAIYLYNSSAIEKKNLLGMIQVQVKGKHVKKIHIKDEISYSVAVSDLINFRGVGGTIFFVIYIVDYDNYKIYFNALLPLDLENILSSIGNQKTKTIKLKEFPVYDLKEVRYLLHNFITNSRKQQSTAKKCFINDFEMAKYDSFVFSTPDLLDYVFKVPTYIYGRKKDINIDIPIAKVYLESIGINKISMQVELDGTVFYNQVSIENTTNSTIIKFGASFSIQVCKDCTEKKCDFNYSGEGRLTERIQDLRFFINLLNTKSIKIGDIFVSESIKIEGYDIEEIKKELDFYLSVQKLMNRLSINKDIDLDMLDEEQFNNLTIIREAIMNKLPVVLAGKREKLFWAKYRIANLVIAIWAEAKENGKYLISNVFDKRVGKFFMKNEKMEEIPSCVYTILKKEDFLELSNINYEIMSSELFSVSYSVEYGFVVNNLLLEMLKAFDEKTNDTILIENVITIAKWLTCQESNNSAFTLNYLQAIKRTRILNQDEREQLHKIKEDEIRKGYNAANLSGINILLENKADFAYYFEKLGQEEKAAFVNFPIYTLGQKINLIDC